MAPLASLAVSSSFIALSSSTESVVAVRSSGESTQIVLKIPQDSDAKGKHNNSESDSKVTADFSSTGSYFAICSGKTLTIWSTADWKVLSSRNVARTASSIKFTPNDTHIVVADKSGDVYLFPLSQVEPGELILGHLSVILDVLISKDSKYILTCDRDEKIRVSNFPNAYNIHCFCLGHKEFVSCIRHVPHDDTLILSSSGDGCIKFWRFTQGLEVSSFSLCSLPVDIVSFSNNSASAVEAITSCKRDAHSSLICLGIPHVSKIIVLVFEQRGDQFICGYHSFVDVCSKPISCCIFNEQLLVLNGEVGAHLSSFQWCCKEDRFMEQQKAVQNLFIDVDLNKFIHFSKNQDKFDYLYKKKYDNVQEYFDKKKARIEAGQ